MDKAHSFHVGLNAHLLSFDENYRAAGINWYIYHILCHLPAADPELRYTGFVYEPRFSPPQNMRALRSRWPTNTPVKRIMWEQIAAPFVLRRERIDLLHAMAFVSPAFSPCPTVVTILDLSFLFFPETFRPINRLYLRWMTQLSVRRARLVIAISENTRRDIINHLKVPAERVRTVFCGVDETYHPLPAPQIASFRQQKGLPDRFVFFLGTIQPRKNLTRLIEAMACLVRDHQTSDVHLIVAGGRGWLYEPVLARVQELGLNDRVHLVGYVAEEEKPLWYNAASCFCFPSLYEGFGLPALEAMACGLPVVASNASSLPEIVNEAGLTVPPTDTEALCHALHTVLTDPVLHADLSVRGVARASQFSWNQAARQTAATYRLAWEQP